MIERNRIYHKSAKGVEAIATRQHGLGPKLRSTLILVDGKRGFDELARLSTAPGDVDLLLGQLLDQGFIEPGGLAAPAVASGSGAKAAVPAAGRGISLADAQRYASRRLFDLLGPSSEPACLRIEAARNPGDFQSAIKLAEVMVSDVRSGKVAADFAADMRDHMPSP
ncbi:MAG: hypothetical protein NDJ19_06395 [Ramlibacter sp.]|nr:hypothetical protein [Ramlibacter sp.]